MNRFWFKGISYLSEGIIKIRYWKNEFWWSDNHKVKDRRTGIRIAR